MFNTFGADFVNLLNGPAFPFLVWAVTAVLMAAYLGLSRAVRTVSNAYHKNSNFQQFWLGFFVTLSFMSVVLAFVALYVFKFVR